LSRVLYFFLELLTKLPNVYEGNTGTATVTHIWDYWPTGSDSQWIPWEDVPEEQKTKNFSEGNQLSIKLEGNTLTIQGSLEGVFVKEN
jgi:hypothetical protein